VQNGSDGSNIGFGLTHGLNASAGVAAVLQEFASAFSGRGHIDRIGGEEWASPAKPLTRNPVMVTIKAGEVTLAPIETGFSAARHLSAVALGAAGEHGGGRTVGR
jgi:hypothetical protein